MLGTEEALVTAATLAFGTAWVVLLIAILLLIIVFSYSVSEERKEIERGEKK
jgi:hypothetical protein